VTKYGSYGVELFIVLSASLSLASSTIPKTNRTTFATFQGAFSSHFPTLLWCTCARLRSDSGDPVAAGRTLNYLINRQAWTWLYGVNIYIAKHGKWSFSCLDHFWSLAIEEHFYLFWPLVVFVLAGRPRALIVVSLGTSLGAMLARLIGSLMGLSWWTTYTLTPFRLVLGAFLAAMARQPAGRKRLTRALPLVVAVVGGLLGVTFMWALLVSRQGLEFVLPVRASLIPVC
jgi:peptidoglycan/LPS O-acetylase OafA/YrhL